MSALKFISRDALLSHFGPNSKRFMHASFARAATASIVLRPGAQPQDDRQAEPALRCYSWPACVHKTSITILRRANRQPVSINLFIHRRISSVPLAHRHRDANSLDCVGLGQEKYFRPLFSRFARTAFGTRLDSEAEQLINHIALTHRFDAY